MNKYVIYDIRFSTYYASGTQRNRNGSIGPRWSRDIDDAIIFYSRKDALIALRRLKSLRSQNNNSCIYKRIY